MPEPKPYTDFLSTAQFLDHVARAFNEDLGQGHTRGDHSSIACFGHDQLGEAQLMIKAPGIIAGLGLVADIMHSYDSSIALEFLGKDGDAVQPGDVMMKARGKMASLLGAERTMLNFLQRLSGVATATQQLTQLIEGTEAQLLDTRKTTPGWRALEKWAVHVGGGSNHRMGLHDMIMLKDNHVDFAGGITEAVSRTVAYLDAKGLDLAIEVETRNMEEVREALSLEAVTRIMLDNFTPAQCREAVACIGGDKEVEASGGLTAETLRAYAETGVDYLSVGALTHSVVGLDMNFKSVCKD